MGEQNKSRRWIVLLNKAPKGPFSADEIRELLAGGILRRNDLACIIEEANGQSDSNTDSNTEKHKGEWKLLWQFQEFDRRAGQAENAPAKQTAKVANTERRKSADTEALRAQALAELPQNWENIAPEDLLHHSTTSTPQSPTAADNAAFDKSLSSDTRFLAASGWHSPLYLRLWQDGTSSPVAQAWCPLPRRPPCRLLARTSPRPHSKPLQGVYQRRTEWRYPVPTRRPRVLAWPKTPEWRMT